MSDRRRLRLVLVHRYFAPDTPPYAHILQAIASDLAARGHDVTVLSCQPSYRRNIVGSAARYENADGYEVRRWPVLDDRSSSAKKMLNLIWFCLRLALSRKVFRHADVVMAATTPPVLVAATCSLMSRSVGARFVYHKQDIYPEVMSASPHGIRRLLRGLDTLTDRRAARVVVLSEDMADAITERGVDGRRIEVINNFDPWQVPSEPLALPAPDRPLTVVFAGNIGRFQGLDAVFDLVRRFDNDPGIVFHFYGDGTRMDDLRALAVESPRVFVHGFAPAVEVAEFVRTSADLGLVSLEPGVIRFAYPSKTMTYLRHGCPLLVLVESSALSRMVKDEGIGVAGSPLELDPVEERLRDLIADRTELSTARQRAAEVYQERFSRDRQLTRWSELFDSVATQ